LRPNAKKRTVVALLKQENFFITLKVRQGLFPFVAIFTNFEKSGVYFKKDF
jgi:hypothetical protein